MAFYKFSLPALDCLEDPATGPSRTWPDEAIFYGTTITYECPYGKNMNVVPYLTKFTIKEWHLRKHMN